MKVLLIQSPLREKDTPIFPLGLCYIASGVKNHEVEILDPNLSKEPFKEIEKRILSFKPETVGISFRNLDSSFSFDKFSYYNLFKECIKVIKKTKSSSLVIVGGYSFSMLAEQILKEIKEIDFGVFQEGEITFSELLENIQNPAKVKGVFFRDGKQICFTGRREFLNFDSLPSPKIDNLNLAEYKFGYFQVGVQTKRGCIYKCVYCNEPFLYGDKVRLRNPYKIVNEVETLVNKNIKNIYFVDSVFNYPLRHAKEICLELIKRGLKIEWGACFTLHNLDQELLCLIQRSGCKHFGANVDGASEKTLLSLRKGFSLNEIMKVNKIFGKSKNIKFFFSFYFNVPGENFITIFSLLKKILITKLQKNRYLISNLRIYPHTELFKIAEKYKLINQNTDLILPIFYNPPPLYMLSFFINLYSRVKIVCINLLKFRKK